MLNLTFKQGVLKGPSGRTTISLPGSFEPDSTVLVVIPIQDRSEPPTPDEFEEVMLDEQGNFEKGIIDEDRVDMMRILDVNTNEIPNTGQVEIEPVQRRVEALVVELRTSIQPGETRFIHERMQNKLNSTFYIDTFSRVV